MEILVFLTILVSKWRSHGLYIRR